MCKILLYARDPAGANVILPVYFKIKDKYETILYAKDFALSRISKEAEVYDIAKECGECSYDDIKFFLERHKPDAVITGTSLNDFTERYMWKAAGELGIRSYAVLDQWINFGIRFSEYDYKYENDYQVNHRHPFMPDRIMAMDNMAYDMLTADGIPEERIVVTGQPYFDVIVEKYEKAQAVYGREYINVVFASEPILEDYDKLYWGYDQMTVFNELSAQLIRTSGGTGRKIRLIVRPHPRENKEKWISLIDKFQGDINVICDTQSDTFDILKSADIVCGMSSMFLFEALLCGKKVISIMIGLSRENPFFPDRLGILKSVTDKKQLEDKLNAMMSDNGDLCVQDSFEYIKNGAENIAAIVREDLKNGKTCD